MPAVPARDTCPYCNWPDSSPFEVISRHTTAAGETVWTRCFCGSVQIRLLDPAGMTIAARGRPTATDADCRA